MFAVQADGARGDDRRGACARRRAAPGPGGFHEEHGLQCGFCTPGMMLTATALLAENPDPTRGGDPLGDLRQHLPLHGLPEHRQGGAAARPRPMRGGETMATDGPRSAARPLRQAQGGRALHPRQGQLRRRHQAARHAPPRAAAQPVRARAHPLDRHLARRGAARRRRRRHRRADGAAQPRLDADPLRRHAGRARHGQGALPGPGGRGGRRRGPPTSRRTRSS